MLLTRPAVLSLAVLLAGSALAGCGSGDDSGSTGGGGLDSGGRFGVERALDALPAQGAGAALVTVGDLAAVSEANGVDQPDSAHARDGDWLTTVTGADEASVAMVVPPATVAQLDPAAYAEAAGFSWVDSDWFASVSVPPEDFTVYAGDPVGAHRPATVHEEDGIATVGEGEDLEPHQEGDLSVDLLGRPVRMATARGLLGVSLSTPALEAWRDGTDDRLGDDASLAAVAAALDDADVVSAVLQGQGADAPVPTVGVGWAADDDGPVVTIAYDLGSDGAAQDAVADVESAYTDGLSAATQQPYADLVPLDGVEARGQVVVATVRPAAGRVLVPWQMLQRQDLPYLGVVR